MKFYNITWIESRLLEGKGRNRKLIYLIQVETNRLFLATPNGLFSDIGTKMTMLYGLFYTVMGSFTYTQVSGLQNQREPTLSHRSYNTHTSIQRLVLTTPLFPISTISAAPILTYESYFWRTDSALGSFRNTHMHTPQQPAVSLLSFYSQQLLYWRDLKGTGQ